MSIWTHVVGNIRVDGLPRLDRKRFSIAKIKKILGPISTYEIVRKTTLPCGSEGSLQYQIIEYGKGMSWIAIAIWGDLRDFDDIEEIKDWLKNIFPKLGMIRDAAIKIQVEGIDEVILTDSDIYDLIEKE